MQFLSAIGYVDPVLPLRDGRRSDPARYRPDACTSSPPLRLPSHIRFNRPPNLLHNFPVPPSSPFSRRLINVSSMPSLIPPIHKEALDSTTPALDLAWHLPSSLSHEYAQDVSKQLLWLPPLVPSELPHLPSCEDGHYSVPIVWFELLGRVDNDETERSAVSIECAKRTGDM